jgi:hypothetical protein
MGSFFSPPKPDTSAMDKQQARLEQQDKRTLEQEKLQNARDAARRRTAKGAGAGGQSLLTGLETGLRDTLG